MKEGAVELLDALQAAECPMAIVTSSSRQTADQHLTLAGIRTRFETILTRDDVTHCKPSPRSLSAGGVAARRQPQVCVAVEDSNHGVAAAHAAGAITLMVPDMVPPTQNSRARCAAVVSDLGGAGNVAIPVQPRPPLRLGAAKAPRRLGADRRIDADVRYFTTAAVCPNSSLRSSSVRIAGWPKFGLTSFALA